MILRNINSDMAFHGGPPMALGFTIDSNKVQNLKAGFAANMPCWLVHIRIIHYYATCHLDMPHLCLILKYFVSAADLIPGKQAVLT